MLVAMKVVETVLSRAEHLVDRSAALTVGTTVASMVVYLAEMMVSQEAYWMDELRVGWMVQKWIGQ